MFVCLTTSAPSEEVFFKSRNDDRVKEWLFCVYNTTLSKKLANISTHKWILKLSYFTAWINIVSLLNKLFDEFRSCDSATISRKVETFNFGIHNIFAACANVWDLSIELK